MGEDVGAREARYAEAIGCALDDGEPSWGINDRAPESLTRAAVAAVLPLVDAEVAAAASEAQAENERMRDHAEHAVAARDRAMARRDEEWNRAQAAEAEAVRLRDAVARMWTSKAVSELITERDALRTEVERLHNEVAQRWTSEAVSGLIIELSTLLRKVEAGIRALADEWDYWRALGPRVVSIPFAVHSLRALLSHPEVGAPCIYCYEPAGGQVNNDGEPICPACIARFSGRGRSDRIARYAAVIAKHYPDGHGRAVDDVIAIADDELAHQAYGLNLIKGHKKATPADVTKTQHRPCAGDPGYCTRHECPGGCPADNRNQP